MGYELTTKGLVFGGDTLTTTDICVAGGHVTIGDGSKVANLDPAMVRSVEDRIEEMVNIAVDRMKTSAAAVPVIVVGGGSILIQRPVTGASEVVKPEHFAVANAIGAAIAQIGGETDRIFSLATMSRDEALAQAKQKAIDKAVAAGAQQAIRDYGPVELYTLDELNDDDLIVPTAMMGAPTVMVEKMPNGDAIVNAFQAVGKYIGKPIRATMSIEAGGMNSVVPIYVAARLRIPMVDCDGMGRAFPELQMDTFAIGGLSLSPVALADCHSNVAVFHHVDSPKCAEQYGRAITIEMGGTAALAMPMMTGAEMRRTIIPGTYTLAQQLGETVLAARRRNEEPSAAVAALDNGRVLFRGKIADVERKTVQGFARGRVQLVGFNTDQTTGEAEHFEVVFQNENLVAWHNGAVVCTGPHLICILSLDDGEPIGTEMLRYGLRVAVLGLPAPKS